MLKVSTETQVSFVVGSGSLTNQTCHEGYNMDLLVVLSPRDKGAA